MTGKPLMATTISPAPSANCTTRATTSTRTDSPPPARRDSVVGGHRLEDVGEPPARGLAAGRHVLGRDAVGRWLLAAQDLTRDRPAGGPRGGAAEKRRGRRTGQR